MISKIFLPTDGSQTALKAAEYAIDLAKKVGASMVLFSAIDVSPLVVQSISPAPTTTRETIEDYLRQAILAHLQEIEDLCGRKGVPFQTIVRSGHPVETIIEEAHKSKADLIVIGSHGRSALKAAVLGSVTFGVIHKDSKIPVLVVRR